MSAEPSPSEPRGYLDPLPSTSDIERALDQAASPPRSLPGVDLREGRQLALLRELAPLYGHLPFGYDPGSYRYGYDNSWFTRADAVFLALMMRHLRPHRVIEVGCGWSSALILDVGDLWFEGHLDITFVEPHAERLRCLTREGDLEGRLIESVVQDVPIERFLRLESGDMLLIDSSHILKAGSDVKYLFDEVLPQLAPGVRVHIHDVLYPFEYPRSWLESPRSFNEAYALRYLLQGSSAYEVELFPDYLARFHHDLIADLFPIAAERPFPTGGLWMRRT